MARNAVVFEHARLRRSAAPVHDSRSDLFARARFGAGGFPCAN
jgi:hypothetical protein